MKQKGTRDSRAVFYGVAASASVRLWRKGVACLQHQINRRIGRRTDSKRIAHLGKRFSQQIGQFRLWDVFKQTKVSAVHLFQPIEMLPSKSSVWLCGCEWIRAERIASVAVWLNCKRFMTTWPSSVASADPVTKRVPHRPPVSVAITGNNPWNGRWPALSPKLDGRVGSA